MQQGSLQDGALTWVGAAAGFAWAGSLRGFMAEIVGDGSNASWLGTFGWVLLPGTLAGALLGWAERERRRGRPHRVLVWSPLLFGAVLLPGLTDIGALLEDGIGGGAIAVPIVLIVGAFALSARQVWIRVVCTIVFVAALSVWSIAATAVGGAEFAVNTPYGAWATILYFGLLVTGALATSLPLRSAPQRSAPGAAVRRDCCCSPRGGGRPVRTRRTICPSDRRSAMPSGRARRQAWPWRACGGTLQSRSSLSLDRRQATPTRIVRAVSRTLSGWGFVRAAPRSGEGRGAPQLSGSSPNTRTSWAQRQATAIFRAHSSASSRAATSSTAYPPSI